MGPKSFLRLFHAFRNLEQEMVSLREALENITQDKLRLQDRLDAALEDRTKLWEMTLDCLRGERTAYQMHVNIAMQKQGGGVPYPDAPHLPPPASQQPDDDASIRRSMLPSEAVARRTAKYAEQILQR